MEWRGNQPISMNLWLAPLALVSWDIGGTSLEGEAPFASCWELRDLSLAGLHVLTGANSLLLMLLQLHDLRQAKSGLDEISPALLEAAAEWLQTPPLWLVRQPLRS